MKRHVFHLEADKEYAAAAAYYVLVDPDLGRRFFEEIERLITDVRTQPTLYRMFDCPARRHFSQVFPFAILYVDQPDRILIVAIMDMRREPGYWKSRLD